MKRPTRHVSSTAIPSFALRLTGIAVTAAILHSCSADATRLHATQGDPNACRPGTFIGEMAGNCPQPVR